MRLTEEECKNLRARMGSAHNTTVGEIEVKPSKYRNQKVKVDGEVFDSKKELSRWRQLLMMEKSGVITELEKQVPFVVIEPVVIAGKKEKATVYVADFVYKQGGKFIVEDTKSAITRKLPVYRLKRKLMKVVHDIDIREV